MQVVQVVTNVHMQVVQVVTLRVDSDGECEHDPLGQERRVTLVSRVQGKPHLHNT